MQIGATMVRGGARRAISLVGRTLHAALQPLQSELSAVFEYAVSIAVWSAKFWALVFVAVGWLMALACSSAITYLLVYSWMIPQYSCQLPVHFDVSTPLVNPHATVQLQGERQWKYAEISNLEGADNAKRSAGHGHVRALDASHRCQEGSLGRGDGHCADRALCVLFPFAARCAPSLAVCYSRYLSSGHQYNAYLDLVFPDSLVNHEAGMQSVEMLVLHDQLLLASSLQSFTPHYTSPLVRWMWSWTWALPLVTGLLHEKQSITLHMFDALTEQEAYPATAIKVMLKSPHAHRFQLYSATLRLQVQLYGVRYLMYHWQLTTGLLVTGMIFGFQLFWSSLFIAVVCLWCCGGATRTQGDEEEEEAEAAAAALARAQEDEAAAAAAASLAFEGKPPPPTPLFQGHAYRTGSITPSGHAFEGSRTNTGYASYTKHRSSSSDAHLHSAGGSSHRSTPPRAALQSSSHIVPPFAPASLLAAGAPGPATPSLLAAADTCNVKLEDADEGIASEGGGESGSASASDEESGGYSGSGGSAVKQEPIPSSAPAARNVLRHRAPKHHAQPHPHPHPPHPAHARAADAATQATSAAAHASDAQPGHATTAADS